jgi:hypothetical protein
VLKSNTAPLQRELDAMRAAFSPPDLDSFVKHDVAFHRSILEASQNEVLLRPWDSLAVDLRIRGAIGKVSQEFPELVESHHPIVDALERGRGGEAGILLRDHVETILQLLKKSESDSEFHRALRDDLEDAKEVLKAFFPNRIFPFRASLARPSIGLLARSVATTMIFFPYGRIDGESPLEMCAARESAPRYSWRACKHPFGPKPCMTIRILSGLSGTGAAIGTSIVYLLAGRLSDARLSTGTHLFDPLTISRRSDPLHRYASRSVLIRNTEATDRGLVRRI